MDTKRKTLSSRQESPDLMVERLQDYLYLIQDVLGMPPTELPSDVEELMNGLDEGLTSLAISHHEMIDEVETLAYDLTSVHVTLASTRRDLEKVMYVLHGIAQPVKTGKAFDAAFTQLVRQATPNITNSGDMTWTLSDARMKEALAAAMEDYIRERARTLP